MLCIYFEALFYLNGFVLFEDLLISLILWLRVIFEVFYITSFDFLAPGLCIFPKSSLNILQHKLIV